MTRPMLLAILVAVAVLAGCSGGDLRDKPRQADPGAVGVTTGQTAETTQPAPPPPPPAAPAAQAAAEQPATELPAAPLVKADIGVGKKGHYDGAGAITTPISTYFRVQERVAFDIQIPANMNLFKGLNGRAPKSHEEFMEKIIKEGGIKLPELPEGHRYVYDPQTEQLMVQQAAP